MGNREVHLCLSDLLDQDLSSDEYFSTLPEGVKKKLENRDDICTFSQLQQEAEKIKESQENFEA